MTLTTMLITAMLHLCPSAEPSKTRVSCVKYEAVSAVINGEAVTLHFCVKAKTERNPDYDRWYKCAVKYGAAL